MGTSADAEVGTQMVLYMNQIIYGTLAGGYLTNL